MKGILKKKKKRIISMEDRWALYTATEEEINTHHYKVYSREKLTINCLTYSSGDGIRNDGHSYKH